MTTTQPSAGTGARGHRACPQAIDAVPLARYGSSKTTLQSLGDGRYQRNWLVAQGLPRSCMRIRLDLGDGEAHEINARLFQTARTHHRGPP